jgi:uncharacterized RDD family membrane protein YckC
MSSADLVTGEAVLLDLRAASFATRMVSAVLDALAAGVLLFGVLWIGVVLLTGTNPAAEAALTVSLLVGVLVVLPATTETLSRGRSLGKLAMGLRVVRDDGGPIRLRHAVVRALVGFGELWLLFGGPAVICSLANDRGKRVGDMLAGTYVVRERSGGAIDGHVAMPQELAGWVRAADIGRIPDRHAMALRQFLSRVERLHAGSRQRLGTALAAETAQYVAPPPPPGTHPERFLAAVVAERRNRNLARLRGERSARERREHSLHRLPFGLDQP